jgi:hypothetical protein
MKRRVRLLPLLGWTMAAACSGGGGEETRGPAASDAAPTGDTPQAAAPAPGRSMSISQGTVPMKITGKLARYSFEESVTGECATSAESSIYDVPATQWHVMFGGDGSNIQHLNLTVWRPRSGAPDMVGLSLQSGEITHRIATVQGGELVGSGTPGVRVEGKGGILTVTGKDDHGHPIELSVQCERFDEVVAEGG